jgi:hypothetical protein
MKSQLLRVSFCAALLYAGRSLDAQALSREVSFAAGVSQFDASGTGTAPVAALRIGAPLLGRWIVGDVSLSYAALDEQFSAVSTRIGVAEGQIQAQLPATRFRPYVGLGGGWLHYFQNAAGRPVTGPTLSGSAGLRVGLSPALAFRAELRLRTWEASRNGGFNNSAAEWTAGLGYGF